LFANSERFKDARNKAGGGESFRPHPLQNCSLSDRSNISHAKMDGFFKWSLEKLRKDFKSIL